MKTKKKPPFDLSIFGLIPPVMVVIGTAIVITRFQKLDEAQTSNLFVEISSHMIIPIFLGILVGTFSGIVPYIIPLKWRYIMQERQSTVWKILLPVLFLIGALPFFGLISSLEWMILLGIFVVVTSLFYFSLYRSIRGYVSKKIRNVKKIEEQEIGMGA